MFICSWWEISLGFKLLFLRYRPTALITMIIVDNKTKSLPVASWGCCHSTRGNVMGSLQSKGFILWGAKGDQYSLRTHGKCGFMLVL